MGKPRKQRCDRTGCGVYVRHGWVKAKSFFCSLTCYGSGQRR